VFIVLLHDAVFCREVIVIRSGETPPFARGTENVPVPGLPAVKVRDAVNPVPAFGADELYTTVYVPVVSVFEVTVTVDELPAAIGDVALIAKSDTKGKGFTVIAKV